MAMPTYGWVPPMIHAADTHPARAIVAPKEMSSSPSSVTIVAPMPTIEKIAAWRNSSRTLSWVRNVSVATARYAAHTAKMTMKPSRASTSTATAVHGRLSRGASVAASAVIRSSRDPLSSAAVVAGAVAAPVYTDTGTSMIPGTVPPASHRAKASAASSPVPTGLVSTQPLYIVPLSISSTACGSQSMPKMNTSSGPRPAFSSAW